MILTSCDFIKLGLEIQEHYNVSLFEYVKSTERKLTTTFIEIDVNKLYKDHSIEL